MKYLVLEIQKNAEGAVATLVTAYDDLPHAEAGFYSLLAVCALSSLPKHGAILMDENGVSYEAKMYKRESANVEG